MPNTITYEWKSCVIFSIIWGLCKYLTIYLFNHDIDSIDLVQLQINFAKILYPTYWSEDEIANILGNSIVRSVV